MSSKTIPWTAHLHLEIPQDWIDFVTQGTDVFRSQPYCGYWARGVEHDEALGWLVWDKLSLNKYLAPGSELNRALALRAWREGWYHFNRGFAIAAYIEGVKLYGVDWFEDADGPRYDRVIQRAAFGGKERYE